MKEKKNVGEEGLIRKNNMIDITLTESQDSLKSTERSREPFPQKRRKCAFKSSQREHKELAGTMYIQH